MTGNPETDDNPEKWKSPDGFALDEGLCLYFWRVFVGELGPNGEPGVIIAQGMAEDEPTALAAMRYFRDSDERSPRIEMRYTGGTNPDRVAGESPHRFMEFMSTWEVGQWPD